MESERKCFNHGSIEVLYGPFITYFAFVLLEKISDKCTKVLIFLNNVKINNGQRQSLYSNEIPINNNKIINQSKIQTLPYYIVPHI